MNYRDTAPDGSRLFHSSNGRGYLTVPPPGGRRGKGWCAFHRFCNCHQNAIKVLNNLRICESKKLNSVSSDILFPVEVIFFRCLSPVSRAINFDCKLALMAVKIDNEWTDAMLTPEFSPEQLFSLQLRPENSFRISCIIAEILPLKLLRFSIKDVRHDVPPFTTPDASRLPLLKEEGISDCFHSLMRSGGLTVPPSSTRRGLGGGPLNSIYPLVRRNGESPR
jgi:hypothetical protein